MKDVLTSTNIPVKTKGHGLVLAKLDGFFQVGKNIIFERAIFNLGNQLEGESSDVYITILMVLQKDTDMEI